MGCEIIPGITLQLAPKDGLYYGSSTRIPSRLIELMHVYLIKEIPVPQNIFISSAISCCFIRIVYIKFYVRCLFSS